MASKKVIKSNSLFEASINRIGGTVGKGHSVDYVAPLGTHGGTSPELRWK
jgi:hypothetical protein